MATQNRRRNKTKLNPTVLMMKSGGMAFKRRMDIPMWHTRHLDKSIEILTELLEALKELRGSNSQLGWQKCMHAQHHLMWAGQRFNRVTPKDPRERGAAHYTYDNTGPYAYDANGLSKLAEREDLDEPLQRPNEGSGL